MKDLFVRSTLLLTMTFTSKGEGLILVFSFVLLQKCSKFFIKLRYLTKIHCNILIE